MTSMEQKKINALERAAKKIEQLKKELARAESINQKPPLAIVGIGCHFPGGADSPESFWDNLTKGVNSISEVPAQRWNAAEYYSPDLEAPGKINTTKGGFLTSDISLFDASFFRISPIEAQFMDPQQRLILEVTWQALENAGINPQTLNGSDTGVYIGSSTNDYGHVFALAMPDERFNHHFGSGNSSSVTAGRVAYVLGTQGPAITCDTACSSSLVTVHLACKALMEGEIDLAIAGGVNLILSPHNSIVFSKARLLASDGHCKTFDALADGYARAEGCGMVLIKRLDDALKANDRILCLIKGSAVNQDGATSGLTVPNPKAQKNVIERALKNAQLTPDDIDLLETHGIGTVLGDSIEIEAIKQVFANRKKELTLGAVKTNIGHLECASGVASLIKVILSLNKEQIPKTLHFKNINPLIDLTPFQGKIPLKNQAWPQNDARIRRAGISSFGLSGTNVHLIVEEAPKTPVALATNKDLLPFCFSAKTSEGLKDYVQSFVSFLDESIERELSLLDISYTLNTGRGQYECRAVVFAHTLLELKNNIQNNRFSLENDVLVMDSIYTDKVVQFLRGNLTNFDSLYPPTARKTLLPYYVFQKKRYWLTDVLEEKNKTACSDMHEMCVNTNNKDEERSYVIDWQSVSIESLLSTKNTELNEELLIINPENQAYKSVQKKLAPLIVQEELSLVNNAHTKHILYIYPTKTQFDDLSAFFDLHQCVQSLCKMPAIKSVGILINNSVEHSIIDGYWKTLRIEVPHKRIYLIQLGTSNGCLSSDSNSVSVANVDHASHNESLLAQIIKGQCGAYCNEHHLTVRNGSLYAPRVLDLDQPDSTALPAHLAYTECLYSANKTYLITGGLGGVGQALVGHLISRGVKNLVLIGRTTHQVLPEWLCEHQAKDYDVRYLSIDSADKKAMTTVINDINNSNAKLGGIFHLAGVLVDKAIVNLSEEDFAATFNAKVKGALLLHELTKSLELECFVLFSSIASTFGSPLQANYAAANSFMDALAKYRRSQGLAALSVNWGPFNEKGITQRYLKKLKAMGLMPLTSTKAFLAMDKLIASPLAHAIVADFNWERISAFTNNTTKLFSRVSPTSGKERPSFIVTLQNTPKEQRENLLTNELRQLVASVLSTDDADSIPAHKEFIEFGFDSLMSVNLWNRLVLMAGSDYTLSKTMLVEFGSIAGLTQYFKEYVFIEFFDQSMRAQTRIPAANQCEQLNVAESEVVAKHTVTQPTIKSPGQYDLLLTGATGTLGGYLARIILEQTDIKLHCLIRAKNEELAFARLRKVLDLYKTPVNIIATLEDRVQVHCGDIIDDRLALTEECYTNLVQTIDCTVHAAAVISLGDSFEELYDSNVLGTKNVIKFSLETKSKSFAYISSYSIMGSLQINENPPFTEDDFDLGQNFKDMGYQKTKFESERLVREAGQNGLKWNIIRPGNIFGDSKTGVYPLTNEAVPSVFYDLFKTVIDTGVAAITQLYFDITPVDYVAKATLHILLQQQEFFTTYHLTNPVVKTVPEIIDLLQDLGYAIELVSADEYIKRVYMRKLKHHGKVYQSLTTSMIQYHAAKTIPQHSTPVDATKTSQLLSKAGITCPPIDKQLLATILSYCIESDYIVLQPEVRGLVEI